MLLEALLFLIVVLLVVAPRVRRQREQALLRKLEQTRDPFEASLLVDATMAVNEDETRSVSTMRKAWPFTFGG